MERLRPRDLVFLEQETPTTPRHNATLEIFAPGRRPAASTTSGCVALIDDRIAFVPRYRQRIRSVPGRLANPVWVDDDHFDLTYHVRRSALPRPGSMDQLRELVARIIARPLDRHPPAVGDVPHRGARGRPVRHPVQVPPGPGRRRRDDRPRPGAPRHRPRARSHGGDDWHPRRRPRRPRWSPARCTTPSATAAALDTLRSTRGSAVRAAGRAQPAGVGRVRRALTGRRPRPSTRCRRALRSSGGSSP